MILLVEATALAAKKLFPDILSEIFPNLVSLQLLFNSVVVVFNRSFLLHKSVFNKSFPTLSTTAPSPSPGGVFR